MVRIKPAKIDSPPSFTPWMGAGYRKLRDAAIVGEASCCAGLWHVMGESHYGAAGDDRPNLTAQVVEQLALPGYRFFDTVLSIVSDKSVDVLDRQHDWGRFAFSNFVQDLLPDDARRPNPHHWDRARAAFFGQLAVTRPKQLLVVGRTAWDNLPAEGYTPLKRFRLQDDWDEVEAGIYAYEADGLTNFTIATWIYHPSSRGKLDVGLARSRVRSVTMMGCNIISDIEKDDDGWFYVNERD